MDELEKLKAEAIYLIEKDNINKNDSHLKIIDLIKKDSNKIRINRIINFYKKYSKLNPKEKKDESLKICKDCDNKFNTNLLDLEKNINQIGVKI